MVHLEPCIGGDFFVFKPDRTAHGELEIRRLEHERIDPDTAAGDEKIGLRLAQVEPGQFVDLQHLADDLQDRILAHMAVLKDDPAASPDGIGAARDAVEIEPAAQSSGHLSRLSARFDDEPVHIHIFQTHIGHVGRVGLVDDDLKISGDPPASHVGFDAGQLERAVPVNERGAEIFWENNIGDGGGGTARGAAHGVGGDGGGVEFQPGKGRDARVFLVEKIERAALHAKAVDGELHFGPGGIFIPGLRCGCVWNRFGELRQAPFSACVLHPDHLGVGEVHAGDLQPACEQGQQFEARDEAACLEKIPGVGALAGLRHARAFQPQAAPRGEARAGDFQRHAETLPRLFLDPGLRRGTLDVHVEAQHGERAERKHRADRDGENPDPFFHAGKLASPTVKESPIPSA